MNRHSQVDLRHPGAQHYQDWLRLLRLHPVKLEAILETTLVVNNVREVESMVGYQPTMHHHFKHRISVLPNARDNEK